jgi:hypothetical protein
MWQTSQDFRFNTRLMRVDVEKGWTAITVRGLGTFPRDSGRLLRVSCCAGNVAPNDLPGHRQRLGPGEDHCEAEIQASKGLEQAGEGEAQGQGGEAEDQEAERRQRTQAESDWRLRGLLQGEKGAHTDPAGATMCALLFGCSVPS